MSGVAPLLVDKLTSAPIACAPSPPATMGRVIGRNGNVMEIDCRRLDRIERDLEPRRFPRDLQRADHRLAPRHVIDMNGVTVVCHGGDMVTTAFYRFTGDLVPREAGKPQPSAAEITRQPPPRRT